MAATTTISGSGKEGDLAPFLLVSDPEPTSGLGTLGLNRRLSFHILRVALPVVFGMVTQTAINILDGAMVGQLPKAEANPGQAAIGIALPFMWLVGGFLSAVWVGTQALTSRRAGEGNDLLAGRVLTNSILLAATSSLVFTVIAFFLTPIVIGALHEDPAIVRDATEYLQIRYVGLLGMVCTFSFKSFFDGVGKTHVFMSVAVVMNLINVLLNYLLIYGFEPLAIPKLGVVGAAWASVLSALLGLLLLTAWSLMPSFVGRYHYYRLRNVNLGVMRELLRHSLTNGAATVVIMLGFVAFYWVVGQVNSLYAVVGNPVYATATQVVIMTAMPSFMTSLAFGSATAAVVSQAMGAQRLVLAERYAWESVKLWAFVMSAFGFCLLLFPDAVMSLFTKDPQVIEVGRLPLRMLAAPHGIIAVAMILAQTLYGVGNARFVMRVELVLHLFVMAPAAYLFGLLLGFRLEGVFMGPLLYALVLAGTMFVKFRRGDWKEIEI